MASVQQELKELVLSNVRTLEKAAKKAKKGKYSALKNYLEDALDLEIKIDGRFRYRSVTIQLAIGGPGLYFNSETSEMIGVWGSDRFIKKVDYEACNEVNDYYEDYFETCR